MTKRYRPYDHSTATSWNLNSHHQNEANQIRTKPTHSRKTASNLIGSPCPRNRWMTSATAVSKCAIAKAITIDTRTITYSNSLIVSALHNYDSLEVAEIFFRQ